MTGQVDTDTAPDAGLAPAGRRRGARTTFFVAGAVLAVSVAAGAATVIGSSGGEEPAAVPVARTSCPADPDLDAAGGPRLAATFAPVAVTVCRAETRRRADGGLDLVAAELRGGDVGAFAAALRLPDVRAEGAACRTVLRPGVGWFALHDAGGRTVRPGAPVDGCGNVRREVVDAFDALRLEPVAETVVRELESAAAAASGCAQDWKNMMAIDAPTARPGRGADLAGGGEVRVCVYRVGGDVGGFVGGGVVGPGERRTALGRALAAARPAVAACERAASRFAVLRPTGANTGGEIYVELDGCRRVLLPAPNGHGSLLAQADPPLIQLIEET